MTIENIKIIKFRKSDYARFLKLKLGKETSKEFDRSLFGYALEGLKGLMDRTRHYKFAILCDENFCGYASIYKIRNFYELGVFIVPKYRKKGIATEVSKRLINYSFKKLKMPKIMAVVDEDKVASKKILKKLGFKFVKKNVREKTQIWEKKK